ncbi:piRNA biogenesis protein EXD1-like [Patiria miniata]|uniref:3'-5' exonuclease domain-containing protein n=1 Tax=Patiria miniata TaxID=46514 RepID=A0A914A2M2_PATMI|nr:piRNA biogenesis protein EXD1-like [Patiria miniata]
MASNNQDPCYDLVDQAADIKPALAKLREHGVPGSPSLAVDCEGETLSRKGVLSIVSVATESHTYLFDVKKLGAKVFDEGLKELLEDPGREKLMFDCRADSDCLWHLCKVRLTNVVDLQLMQMIYQETHPILLATGSASRAQLVKNFQPKRHNFLFCLEQYVKDDQLIKAKAEGKPKMEQAGVWLQRPLDGQLLSYAAADVQGFFPLYRALKPGIGGSSGAARLQVASQRFLDYYRSLAVRTYDKFEKNCFLPWRLLPPYAHATYAEEVTCFGCKRRFPREDFLPFHVKRGNPNCPVCRKMYAQK